MSHDSMIDAADSRRTPAGPRLRVVHVTTVPSTLGFLRGQAEYFRSRGIDVMTVSSPGPELDEFSDREGVPARGVEMARRISPWSDLAAVASLWKIFREVRPDVVHGHTPKGGLLSMIAAGLAGVPRRIYSVHGLPLETATGWTRRLLRWTERASGALAHLVHAVSESLADRIRAERLCRRAKLRVFGRGTINGVDARREFVPDGDSQEAGRALRALLGIPGEARVVGFAGRLVRDKGIEELEAAWSTLRSEFPDLHLLIAGLLEPRDPVPTHVLRRLKEDVRVHLAGHIGCMPAFHAACDVVALPTRREGFPQVPLEAAAMERPVVASRVTGCIDAIEDGRTGTLVPPGHAPALAAALAGYLEDPERRRRHGRAARERVLRDFRPETLWREFERAYRRRRDVRRPADGFIKGIVEIAGGRR